MYGNTQYHMNEERSDRRTLVHDPGSNQVRTSNWCVPGQSGFKPTGEANGQRSRWFSVQNAPSLKGQFRVRFPVRIILLLAPEHKNFYMEIFIGLGRALAS